MGSPGVRQLALVLLMALSSGCGTHLVLRIPSAPGWLSKAPEAATPRPIGDCDFMTVLIDYSEHGDAVLAARVADVMANELSRHGGRVTSDRREAYWSLMILAARSHGNDDFIFSAIFALRNLSEGFDPGVSVFADPNDPGSPSLYNGFAYGPEHELEASAREYVRRAYAAVYPTASRICAFASLDEEREKALEEQIPVPL